MSRTNIPTGTSDPSPRPNRTTVHVDGIPPLMKADTRWVAWRYVWKEDRWTKVPLNVHTEGGADSTESGTWATFEDALAKFNGDLSLDGIGFVVAEGDGLAGVDLDDVFVDGDLTAEAKEIVSALDSYTEVTPSGNGVRVYIRATKVTTKCKRKLSGDSAIEIYDRKRYFTVTGNHVAGTPTTVEPRQDVLDALTARLWPPASKKPRQQPESPAALDDVALLTQARKAKNGAKFCRLFDMGDTSGYADDASSADMALCAMLAFWTAKDADRMDRLFRQSGLMREKWDDRRGDTTYGCTTIEKAVRDCTTVFGDRARPAPSETARALVMLGHDEYRAINEATIALGADPEIYRRGADLVRVVRTSTSDSGREEGSLVIQIVPPANIRDRLTRYAQIMVVNAKGQLVDTHPATWLVSGVFARGEWPGFRSLAAVSEVPILRPDGSICQTPGYDPETCVLYSPNCPFPIVPDAPTEAEVQAALALLLDLVVDVKFESPIHKAAWLAALLTPLARFAFDGPAPLFLFDANIRGAGKGLLCHIIGLIVLGHLMPTSTYTHNSDELRKQITAAVMAGDPVVLLDNIDGQFGNGSLDRALTSTRWRDRVLGTNNRIDLPLTCVLFGTGNNIVIAADTARRVVHCRLDVLTDKPEDRDGFKYPDLLGHVRANRPQLLSAAMTILRAFLCADKPGAAPKPPMGSFEGWSGLVRKCVVWVGLPDPCAGRDRMVLFSDSSRDDLSQLLAAWGGFVKQGEGLVIAEMIEYLYPPPGKDAPTDEPSVEMRTALEQLVTAAPGRPPTARRVAKRLAMLRRRVCDGCFLDFDPKEKERAGAKWRLHRADSTDATMRVCDSDSQPGGPEIPQ